jgi:large subunit ribosomal protein L27Ae
VVLLVVNITIGTPFTYLEPFYPHTILSHRTNFDKYHPGYFGKVGMRHFHLTGNQYWRPVINVDKLWSLVPEEQKHGLTEESEVVPVIDTLQHGYGKVLGNGQ